MYVYVLLGLFFFYNNTQIDKNKKGKRVKRRKGEYKRKKTSSTRKRVFNGI